ncbi:MAG TPA: CDP-alcohol phosphatidyltransferase family protein [Terriglobales bacterium]|nr:CDP-alcohol phosphatidyltransferase family protein [Terriglobales bacterium]
MANASLSLTGFRDAIRLNHSLTAAHEKRALIWMAARTPRWISSDHLSALGVAAMAAAGAAYWMSRATRWWLLAVVACLAVNWLGDSLDGTLARFRDRQRPRYGFYLDHVLDALGVAFLLGGLALSGYVAPLVALGLLAAYLMLMVEAVLATYSLGEFRMSFAWFGPTELRIVLALGTLALWRNPMPLLFGVRWRLFDLAGAIAIAGMLAVFLVAAARNTARLYREEPLP